MFRLRRSFLLIIFILFSFFAFQDIFAENSIFLENLPGMGELESKTVEAFKKGGDVSEPLGLYVKWIINTSVILGSIIAVGMIIFGGITYMTTDSFSGKSEGKEYIKNSLMGLIFLIAGYLIFLEIDPNILNFHLTGTKAGVSANITKMDMPGFNSKSDDCDDYQNWYKKEGERLKNFKEVCSKSSVTISDNVADIVSDGVGIATLFIKSSGVGILLGFGVDYLSEELLEFAKDHGENAAQCAVIRKVLIRAGYDSASLTDCHKKGKPGTNCQVSQYCLLVNPAAFQGKGIAKFLEENKGKAVWCAQGKDGWFKLDYIANTVANTKALIPFNNGNGVNIKVFTENENRKVKDKDGWVWNSPDDVKEGDIVCTATNKLNKDEWDFASEKSCINDSAWGDRVSGHTDCSNLLDDVKEKYTKNSKCYKMVYDNWTYDSARNKARLKILIKKDCKKNNN